jgi:hypothetical protein
VSCKTTPNHKKDYVRVDIQKLNANPEQYDGKRVVIEGHVLGTTVDITDQLMTWILTVGDKPYSGSGKDRLVFPSVSNKTRAIEDGYNHVIIERCDEVCLRAKKRGEKIKVYGEFYHKKESQQYVDGIRLYVDAIESGSEHIHTDYRDISKTKAKAPSYLKRVYKLGKKAIDLVK